MTLELLVQIAFLLLTLLNIYFHSADLLTEDSVSLNQHDVFGTALFDQFLKLHNLSLSLLMVFQCLVFLWLNVFYLLLKVCDDIHHLSLLLILISYYFRQFLT